MNTSIWEAIKEYRAASSSTILSKQEKEKEKNLAIGKSLLGAAEKAEKIPWVVGTLFGAGAMAGKIDMTNELGFALAGTIVIAKAFAAIGKKHELVSAYKNRDHLEEKVALYLNDDLNEYLNKQTKMAFTSMEMLIGYNRACNSAKKFNDYEGFIKFGKSVVIKAMAFAEERFLSNLESEEERVWVDRFIKKPINKIIPESLREYFLNAKEKTKLLDWVENKNENFESGSYKKILDKEERGLFASHKIFEKDIEKVFKESYSEIVSSSIKTKFVNLVDEYFENCHRFRNKDILKKDFDKNFRDKFEKVADLYKDTKNEKYFVISKFAELAIKNIDEGKIKHIKGWNNKNDSSTNKKIITQFFDQMAVMKDRPRILNIEKEGDPIITIFNKKLEAIMDMRSKKDLTIGQAEKQLAEASFSEIEFNSKELEQFKESKKKYEQENYMENYYTRTKNKVS